MTRASNLNRVALNVRESQCSYVMYIRLAASSQFQVRLITKVIPPEQQLLNGRRC